MNILDRIPDLRKERSWTICIYELYEPHERVRLIFLQQKLCKIENYLRKYGLVS